MPHIVVKLKPGRPDAVKEQLAQALTEAMVSVLGVQGKNVSVAVEEIPGDDWMAKVYEPEIAGKAATLVKKPGYGSLAK